MKSHFINAAYQWRTYSNHITANAFAEALEQSKNLFSYFIPWSVSRQDKNLHTRNVLSTFPLNLPLVSNEYILEFKLHTWFFPSAGFIKAANTTHDLLIRKGMDFFLFVFSFFFFF